MKTILDNKTGTVIIMPESDPDTRLLYHLMNCADLTQFSEYLSLETRYDSQPVTNDIGVPVSLLDEYPISDRRRIAPQNRLTEKRLIGFNRDSSHAGF